ncbi:MAG: hypothetical protein IPM31_11060 [Anaerolineae bacterium]|nr:hypothetical protein [Anaerolineae bacterium]MBL8104039.1 hypothetical protein [Anaerolineales bacterium]MCC7190804.1 hypothetical protein [Anaerolineales bacterium]
MTLAISFRRSIFLPQEISSGSDSPRKVHWVGGKAPVEPKQNHAQNGDHNSGGKSSGSYHSLSHIKFGEVQQAFHNFLPILIPSDTPGWVAPGYFCFIPLAQAAEYRPSAVFGRVKACYPSDGVLQNIREMELWFPKPGHEPLELNIRRRDIDFESDLLGQSYCAKIHIFISPGEQADFARFEGIFLQHGYIPEFITRYVDLADVNEFNHNDFPDVIVVSSRWFESAREISDGQIYEKLHQLIKWRKTVVNYHPLNVGHDVRTLNRELGFKHGFTDTALIEPETPAQTLEFVSRTFDRIFMQGMR